MLSKCSQRQYEQSISLRQLTATRVAVQARTLITVANAAVVVLRRASVVESVGVSARVGESAAVVSARLEKLSSAGGKVIIALRVLARTNAVVVLSEGLAYGASLTLPRKWLLTGHWCRAQSSVEQPAVTEFSRQTQLAARENPFLYSREDQFKTLRVEQTFDKLQFTYT